jgi:peptidoglycan-associated lipoprotein
MKRLATVLTIATVTVACANEQPATHPPPPAVAHDDAPPAKTAVQVDSSPDASQIVIAKSIREACDISDAEAFFEFDSSRVSSTGNAVLEQLSDCFDTGPLRGEPMALVGHADPRGSDEYNDALGERRAESVKKALGTFGLSASVITTSSRGETEASLDSARWAHDRRVDVTLGE